MKSLKRNKNFLIISILIALSDIVFIGINYQASLRTLEKETGDWALQAENNFKISLENKATSMQQLATFIANDPRVASLFQKGKYAVLSEGGGPGKDRAMFFREKLFELVKPSWQNMTAGYDVRQLHFHLGPGSTSYLRVHRPKKFGDNMDDVRYTVVDVNQNHVPTKGFETGRVYSGIRGVVPVFSKSKTDGNKEHIGALEAGTSFTVLLRELRKNLDSEFAVLLRRDHVYRNMWKAFVNEHFSSDRKVGDYFIEASTKNHIIGLFEIKAVTSLLNKQEGSIILQKPHSMQICVFPLQDYRGGGGQKTARLWQSRCLERC